MANLPEVAQWGAAEDEIYQFELVDFITGGAGGNDNEPHRLLANRTRYLKNEILELKDVGKQFVADRTGTTITYLTQNVKDCNNHFLQTAYPADGRITCAWAISSGLAPVSATDVTMTDWFAIADLNNLVFDNAIVQVNGIFYYNEPGYYETPAYSYNYSATRIELVVLPAYRQAVAQYPIITGAVNPYSNVNHYVQSKMQEIIQYKKNTNTGEDIIALPRFNDWNGAALDYYIKCVGFENNPWMDKQYWQPATLFARFVNVSAGASTASTRNADDTNYVPGQMTPQPITQFNGAFIDDVSGTYYYKKIMKSLVEEVNNG